MERLHAIVSGRVQMVFYRDFTLKEARALNLTGFVQNLPDGTVEVVAEGERASLEAFLVKLKCGPYHAEVSGIQEKWLPAENSFTIFAITYV